MRLKDKKLLSVSDLIRYLKSDASSGTPYWFRGQANVTWKLLPYLARRKSLLKTEQSLIERFKQDATLLVATNNNSEWDWLTTMQHYGAPTRLLDWTESPLVALYFAVFESFSVDGSVWVVLPCELNKLSNIEHEYSKYIPHFNDSVVDNYKPSSVAGEKTTNLNPIALMGPRNTTRMQAQLGVFTITHREARAIETIGKGKHVWRYVIPKNQKKKILEELKMLKIGKFQLFPELQIIGENLKVDNL